MRQTYVQTPLSAAILIISIIGFLLCDCFASTFDGTCTPDRLACVFFSPSDMPIYAVGNKLRAAKRKIRIAAYNMNIEEYATILQNQLIRHSDFQIELLIDYQHSWKTSGVWARFNEQAKNSRLQRWRIPVMRGGLPQMHNKIIIIDDEEVLLGSANFTESGLVSNYENVLSIRSKELVDKFNDELDELRDTAKIACGLFATDKNLCGTGTENWDAGFKSFAMTGSFPQGIITDVKPCQEMREGRGLFNERNQPKSRDLKGCFINDTRYLQLVEQISRRETYVSRQKSALGKFIDNQTGRFRVYFSPEDGIEEVILAELRRTLENGRAAPDAFAYVSTNFITNRRLAEQLIKLKAAGVKMKIFFDRGRIEDQHYQQLLNLIDTGLGFSKGTKDVSDKLVTIFDNQQTSSSGCNHNKFAVIGAKGRIRLINGSANWSVGAMSRNDENLLVAEDPHLAAIYLREILSQLYVYRYFQDVNSAGFRDDLNYLSERVPCLRALLGDGETACDVSSIGKWVPLQRSSASLSVQVGDPIERNGRFDCNYLGGLNSDNEDIWVWVGNAGVNQSGRFLKLVTSVEFGCHYMTSSPGTPGTRQEFKFLRMPKNVDPNKSPPTDSAWEYAGPNRSVVHPSLSVEVINGPYRWGLR